MELVLPIVGIAALAIVAGGVIVLVREVHTGAKTALANHLSALKEMHISLPEKDGKEQTTTALAVVDLDLQLEQFHRGRSILQSGLLLVAVVAVVCVTALASVSVARNRPSECKCANDPAIGPAPAPGMVFTATTTGRIAAAVNSGQPAGTNGGAACGP